MDETPKSYSHALTKEQAERLKVIMTERGFEFREVPYALFAGRLGKLQVTIYEKGPKVLVQGKETADFVRFTLEPEVIGAAELGYEDVHHPDHFEPHIGVDESGKGDFFGPLVIAGVYLDQETSRAAIAAGAKDSKSIGSDAKIQKIANSIKCIPRMRSIVIKITPEKYNDLYLKFKNLNRLLAWAHARVIEDLLEQVPDCPRALSDQFANPAVLQKALMEKGRAITLEQRTKAESDPAVAAASILARAAYVDWMDRASQRLGVVLPKGAGPMVPVRATELVAARGGDFLKLVAKTHFRTAHTVAPDFFSAPPEKVISFWKRKD